MRQQGPGLAAQLAGVVVLSLRQVGTPEVGLGTVGNFGAGQIRRQRRIPVGIDALIACGGDQCLFRARQASADLSQVTPKKTLEGRLLLGRICWSVIRQYHRGIEEYQPAYVLRLPVGKGANHQSAVRVANQDVGRLLTRLS